MLVLSPARFHVIVLANIPLETRATYSVVHPVPRVSVCIEVCSSTYRIKIALCARCGPHNDSDSVVTNFLRLVCFFNISRVRSCGREGINLRSNLHNSLSEFEASGGEVEVEGAGGSTIPDG